jgi:ribosome-associated protein
MIKLDFTSEINFTTSRSGGKGGQHANKRETKVTLNFDVENSHLLNNKQKERIKAHLSNRINKKGVLKLSSQESRSQVGNKKIVLDQFYCLFKEALQPKKQRKPTRPPRSANEKRLKEKRKQSEKKERRRKDKDTQHWLDET